MSEYIGVRLGLDMESVKGDLAQMRQAMKNATAELKSHAEEYKLLEDSSEKYGKSLNILSDQQELQKMIVDEQRKAYEKMRDEKGELHKDTQRAFQTYKREETSLHRVGNEIKKTTDSMEKYEKEQEEALKSSQKLEKQTDGLSDSTEDLSKEVKGATDSLGKNSTSLKDTGKEAEKAGVKYDELTKKVQSAGDRIGETSKGVMDAGGRMTAGISAPILAVGGLAAKSAMDHEASLLTLKQTLGLTTAETEKYGDIAKKVYEGGYGESSEEVNASLIQVKQNLGDIDDADLGNAMKSAMSLSRLYDTDVNEVTRGASALMTQYGYTSEEAFDLMVTGAQNGLNKSNEMFDNMAEYTTHFSAMGFTAEEMFAILEEGMAGGAYNLDFVNDAMKEFNVLLQEDKSESFSMLSNDTEALWHSFLNGEATAKEVFGAVTSELESMDDTVLANQIGVDLFGTKWEDLGTNVIYAMGGANKEMEVTKGAMSDLNKESEGSFSQDFLGTMREMQTSLEPLGYALLDIVKEYMPQIKSAVEWVTEFLTEMSPAMQKTVIIIAGIAAALGPLLAIIGAVGTGVAIVVKVIGGLMPLIGILAKAFLLLATPVGAVVAGVGVLVTVLGILAGKFFASKSELDGFAGVLDGMKIVFNNVVEWVKNFASKVPEYIATFVATAIVKFQEFKTKITETIASFVLGAVVKFIEFKDKVVSTIVGLVLGVVTRFIGLRDKVNSTIAGLVLNVYTKMVDMRNKVVNTIVNLVTNIVGKIVDMRNNVVNTIVNFVTNVVGKFNDLRNKVVNTIVNFVTNVVGNFVDLRNKVVGTVSGFATNVVGKFNEVRDKAVNSVTNAKDRVIGGFNTMRDRAVSIVTNLKDRVKKIFDDVVGFAKGLPGRIGDGIKSMASKVVSGVSSLGNKMASKLGDVVNGVIKGVNSVTDKIGVSANLSLFEVPKFSTGTEGHQGGLMTVGDRGPGNSGLGQVRELVQFPDGRTSLVNEETTLNAPKGTQVFSNKSTERIIKALTPKRYSRGTLNGGGGGLSSFLNKGGDVLRGIKNGALDVWDALSDPKKMLDGIVNKFMSRLDGMARVPLSITKGSVNGVKESALGFLNKTKEEATPKVKGNSLFPGFRLNYDYGRYPFDFNGGQHYGQDYGHVYQSVLAPLGGVVSRNFWDNGGGKSIEIKTGKLYQLFMHMQDSIVKAGQTIKAGQKIGTSGNTGANTTGPHLHYQIHTNPNNFNASSMHPNRILKGGSGIFGGAGGGASKFGFYTGGIVSQGLYHLGERGDEMVLPLNDYDAFGKLMAYANEHYFGNKGNSSKRTRDIPDVRGKGNSDSDNGMFSMFMGMFGELKEQTRLMREENAILREQLDKETVLNMDGRRVSKVITPHVKKDMESIDSRDRRFGK